MLPGNRGGGARTVLGTAHQPVPLLGSARRRTAARARRNPTRGAAGRCGARAATGRSVPLFAVGGDVVVREDAGPQRIAAWATAIRAGTTFSTADDNAALFAATAVVR